MSAVELGEVAGGPGAVAVVLGALSEVEGLLGELRAGLVFAGSSELADLMGALGAVGIAVDAAEVAVAAEAFERGEPAAAVPPASQAGWVQRNSGRYALWGAGRLAKVAAQCMARAVKHEGHELFAEAVTGGEMPVAVAAAVLGQMERLEPVVVPEAVPSTWEAFVAAGRVCSPAGVMGFREEFLARFGGADALEKPARRAREAAHLSVPRKCADGLFDYLLTLDSEAAAVVEAAVGALSAPRPDPETGEPDRRSAGRRRAEALVEVIGAGAAGCEGGQSRAAHVFVTIPASDLIPDPEPSPRAGSGNGSGSAPEHGPAPVPEHGPAPTRSPGQSRSPEVEESRVDVPSSPGYLMEHGQTVEAVETGQGLGPGDVIDTGQGVEPGEVIDLRDWSRQRPSQPDTSAHPGTSGRPGTIARPDVGAHRDGWADPDVGAAEGTRMLSPRVGAGAGTVLGSVIQGTVLPVSTVTKLACDAHVTPVITFDNGAPMVLGRTVRLFTPAQFRALILRDRGCTFPGCTMPSTWSRAHHLIHWVDGGPTDLGNAALLCQRHHTTVHTHRYHGWIEHHPDGPRVHWDTTAGSYDRHVRAVAGSGVGEPVPQAEVRRELRS